MLVMMLLRQLDRDVMSQPSHAGNNVTEVTWVWPDVSDESCWL
jgi:hypothetical protein